MKAYKIVEVEDGAIRTLFHGLDGSRTVPKGQWLRAKEHMVKDGTSKTTYLSGWHVLLNYSDAVEYMKNFTKRLDLLQIVECSVEDIRPKEHSPSPVYLAKAIRFGEA